MEYHPFSIGNTSSKGPFSIAMLVYMSVTSMDTLVWAFVKIVHDATQGCWMNKNNSPSLQELLECTVVMTHWPQWFFNHPDWLNVFFCPSTVSSNQFKSHIFLGTHDIQASIDCDLLDWKTYGYVCSLWNTAPRESHTHKQPTWYGLVRANSLLRWSISCLGTSNTNLKY